MTAQPRCIEGFVQLGAASPAQPEAAEEVQPREGALDYPAQPADAGAEVAAVLVVVVTAIGDQLLGALAGTAAPAAHRAHAVHERQQRR